MAILNWVAVGRDNAEIAEIMSVSIKSIDSATVRIYRRMNVSSRTQMVIKGVRDGIIKLS